MGIFGYGFEMIEQIQNKDRINRREKSYKRYMIKLTQALIIVLLFKVRNIYTQYITQLSLQTYQINPSKKETIHGWLPKQIKEVKCMYY